MTYFHQDNRFLKISGSDAFSFLQAMVSRDIRNLHHSNQPVYSLLLNNKGKYKFDFFIWPWKKDSYLLESQKIQIEGIKKLLSFYKLRADILIEDYTKLISISSLSVKDDDFKPDPRCQGLYRALKARDTIVGNNFDYHLWRIQNGFAEYADLKSDEDTPIEVGFDDLNAISYDKGCFLGQEGTNKAKHRLVIKQRLFPFEANFTHSSDNLIFNEEQKIAGEIRLFEQGHGLAFIKLKYLKQKLYLSNAEIKVNHPFWLNIKEEQET